MPLDARVTTDETVPCRLCGCETRMLGTKLCDRCWELEGRIRNDPKLSMKIIEALEIYEVITVDSPCCCPFNVMADTIIDGAGDDEHFICKVLVLDDGKRARCNGRDIPPYCPMREGEIILKLEDK